MAEEQLTEKQKKEEQEAKQFMETVTKLANSGKNTAEIMETMGLASATFNSRLVKYGMATGIQIPKMTVGRRKPADRDWAKVKTNATFVLGAKFATHLNVKAGQRVSFKETTQDGKNVVIVSKEVA